MSEERSYLKWDSLLTPNDIYSDYINLGSPVYTNNTLYWLEGRPSEQGRQVIVKRNKNGNVEDLTPRDYYVRTRVHEYGGLAFAIGNTYCYFVNFKDQRIYQQDLSNLAKITPITPEKNIDGSIGKYAVLRITPDQKSLIFIYEQEYEDKENINTIAMLPLTIVEPLNEPIILVQGNIFYGEPILSPDGKKLAWLTWNHPDMPWDTTELWIADFTGSSIQNSKKIFGGKGISICSPIFTPDGNLIFVMDQENQKEIDPRNWWNWYCYYLKSGKIDPLTTEFDKEFGYPMWLLGWANYVFLKNKLFCTYYKENVAHLVSIDLITREITPLQLPFTAFSTILSIDSASNIYIVAASQMQYPAVIKVHYPDCKYEVIKSSSSFSLPEAEISLPEFLTYPTSDGGKAFAHYYKPKNSHYIAPKDDLSPLIVMVHGGPTGNSSILLSLSKQFWTQSGYAILDIEHRGSTGFGRKYRDALKGQWGLIDAYDVRDGIKYLQERKMVSDNVVITGGSAGGYAVQRALTMFPDLFKAGASYFGIGNLFTLVKSTHKFESRYINQLVSRNPDNIEEELKNRSPINSMDQLNASMILFQGSEDKIVTPENSREIAAILKKKEIYYEYVEYSGESHGFRKKENNIDSLTKEAAFYRKVLSNS